MVPDCLILMSISDL